MQANCICRVAVFHRNAVKTTIARFQIDYVARVSNAKPTCRADSLRRSATKTEAARRRRFGPQRRRLSRNPQTTQRNAKITAIVPRYNGLQLTPTDYNGLQRTFLKKLPSCRLRKNLNTVASFKAEMSSVK
jgi:hypothetical protein